MVSWVTGVLHSKQLILLRKEKEKEHEDPWVYIIKEGQIEARKKGTHERVTP